MKLSKYVHIVHDDEFTLLFNTINSCIVELPPVSVTDIGFQIDSLSQDEKKYLENNDFFIKDQDAIERFLEVPQSISLNIIVSLTEYCNLRCVYCYESNILKRSVICKDTIDKIIQYIEQVITVNPQITEIHFDLIGGEPLLAIDSIAYLIERASDLKVPIYYLLETNGTLFTENVRDVFCDTNMTAHITLSLPKDHNQMRPFLGNTNDGTCEQILKNLVDSSFFFRKANHNLVLRYNLHKGNMDSFDEYIQWIKKQLQYDFLIEIAPIVDYEYNESCGALTVEDFSAWFLPKYFGDTEHLYTTDDFLLPSMRYKQCVGYQKNNIKIHADGSLALCNAWIKENRRGNIDMLLGGVTKEQIFPCCSFSKHIDDECRNCGYLFLCGGKRICKGDNQCRFVDFDIDNYLIRYAKERGE